MKFEVSVKIENDKIETLKVYARDKEHAIRLASETYDYYQKQGIVKKFKVVDVL